METKSEPSEIKWIHRAIVAQLAMRHRKTGALRPERLLDGFREGTLRMQQELNSERHGFLCSIMNSATSRYLAERGSLIYIVLKYTIESNYLVDTRLVGSSDAKRAMLRCMVTGSPDEKELWAFDVSSSLDKHDAFEHCVEESFAVNAAWSLVVRLLRWWVMWPSHLILLVDDLQRDDVSADKALSDARVIKFMSQTRSAKDSLTRVFNVLSVCVHSFNLLLALTKDSVFSLFLFVGGVGDGFPGCAAADGSSGRRQARTGSRDLVRQFTVRTVGHRA